MRTLAIDLGTKRVGLAIGDAVTRLATPLDVLEISSPDQAVELVLKVVRREAIDRLVVGLPLNMDGSAGGAVKSTVAWARGLAERAGLPVVFVDERLSSFAAEQQLVERKRAGEKLTRGKKKRQLDALAAAAFLRDYLEGRLAGIDAAEVIARS